MLATLVTAVISGLRGELVHVEVDVAPGLPVCHIVGLPDAALSEARERVRGALRNAGFEYPLSRITVNLAPADRRKRGAAYDLAIAMGILVASGQIQARQPWALLGELSLAGTVLPVPGALPMVATLARAGHRRVVLPAADVAEASLVDGVELVGVEGLDDAARLVAGPRGRTAGSAVRRPPLVVSTAMEQRPAGPHGEGVAAREPGELDAADLAEVRGQGHARWALEVALAGGHNLLLSGPPGAGKTLLARCIPGLLTPLTDDEAQEVAVIRSVAGLGAAGDGRRRPFRSPHHTTSYAAMVGGGPTIGPGLVTLAHTCVGIEPLAHCWHGTSGAYTAGAAFMVTAAIYTRISQDRDGDGLGVARQEADCRTVAQQRGWEVSGVYRDNDVSAYSGRKRPEYTRLMEDVRSGAVKAIVAWHPDRLHRSPKELEDFIDDVQRAGCDVVTVQAGHYDLASATGQLVARTLGSIARFESDHKSDRIKRKHLELAQAGRLVGGGTRPFGYEEERRTLRADEAATVRDLAARVLAGESLRSVARNLNDRGIKTSTGGTWQVSVVRRLLLSARIAGWREHHGEVIAKGEWSPIITLDQHRALVARLCDPDRRTSTPYARRYLLTGMLRCGKCGGRLVARPREDKTRTYVCQNPPLPGCGKLRVLAEPLESLVAEMVVATLDHPEFEEALAQRNGQAADQMDDIERLAADKTRRNDLAAMWARGDISQSEYLSARKVLADRIEAAEQRIARRNGTTALVGVIGRKASQRWPSLSFDQQRAVIAALLDHVAIGPGRKGYNRFDPNRVQPCWRA